MNTAINLEREILALPAAERERLATVARESLVDDPGAPGDRNIDAEGIETISHAEFLRHTGGVSE